jgi:hypothetical protein
VSFIGRAAPAKRIGPPQSFLLYGDTGTRKTSAIGELVKRGFFKKVLILNLDNSVEVLGNDPEVMAAIEDGRITIIDINPLDMGSRIEVENIVLEVCGMWRNASGDILPNPNIPDFGYDLLVIDTVNLLHEIALKQFMATTYNDAGTKLDGQGAYAKIAVWDDEILRTIHNSKRVTGGFLMHAKTVEDKTGSVKIKPKLSGSYKDSIGSLPSIVAYLDWQKSPETGLNVLTATVGESDIYESKNRYALPPKIFDFNLADVYQTIADKAAAPAVAPATTAAVAA